MPYGVIYLERVRQRLLALADVAGEHGVAFREEPAMRSLLLTAVVTPHHTLTVTVPADITPGPHRVVVLIHEDVPLPPERPAHFLNWPAHAAAPADPSCTFRREDLYGDDGR